MNFFLTIAASDTSGGAGVIQDIRVAEILGYKGLCAITAVTSQSLNKVFNVFEVSDDALIAQLNVLEANFSFDVLKVGVIVSEKQIHIISNFLQKSNAKIKVIDTVFKSSSGMDFLSKSLIETYKDFLLPFCTFLTPNRIELELLAKRKITTFEEAVEEGLLLHQRFGCGIIIKGGHFYENEKKVKEVVIYNGNINFLEKRRLNFKYSHGTGCAFSTAFAVYLNETKDPVQSAKKATLWVNNYFKKLNDSLVFE